MASCKFNEKEHFYDIFYKILCVFDHFFMDIELSKHTANCTEIACRLVSHELNDKYMCETLSKTKQDTFSQSFIFSFR